MVLSLPSWAPTNPDTAFNPDTLYYAMLRHANLRHVTLGRDIVGGADDVVVFSHCFTSRFFGNK